VKLVYDADKVVTLPKSQRCNIAEQARNFGLDVEGGDWGDVTRVVVLVENECGITPLGWGEQATAYEMMGMFEAAKLKVFAEDFCEE
jgi:hypothetical protein